MNFEKALNIELNSIQGLNEKIFPLFAPEKSAAPFVVYRKTSLEYKKNLNGFSNKIEGAYEIVIVTQSYSDLQIYSEGIVNKIASFLGRVVGTDGPMIDNISIRQNGDQYEYEANLYRANIHIEIKY